MKDETICASTPDVNTEGFASLAVPVSRASTIVFADAQAYATRHQRGDEGSRQAQKVYGRYTSCPRPAGVRTSNS